MNHTTVTLDAPGKESGRMEDEAPGKVIFDVTYRTELSPGPFGRGEERVRPVCVSVSDLPLEWLMPEKREEIFRKI